MILTLNLATLADQLANQWCHLTGQRRRARQLSRCRVEIENLENRELLTIYTVTTNIDEILVDNALSLREAIGMANANPGEDEIVFAEDANGSIDLVFGQLSITDSVSIHGNGATHTIINGQHSSRVFDVTSSVGFVVLDSVSVTNGQTSGTGESGGGIRSLGGTLIVSNSEITGNATTGPQSHGGGLFAQNGDISIIASTIAANSTSGLNSGGSGVRVESGVLSVQNSTVSGNSAGSTSAVGGAISVNGGALAVSSSTLVFNSSASTTQPGGGIFANNADVTLINSILAANTNATAPDLYRISGTLSIQNTLVGSNQGTSLTEAQSPDANGNLIGSSAAPINPLVGPLADNGGRTLTHALQATSPAIDRGLASLAFDSSDQRGDSYLRIAGVSVDMGSFERQALSLRVTTADDENDPTFDPDDLSLREAITLANAYPGLDSITFASSLDGVPLLLTLGELTISDTVRINGAGVDLTVLDAQQASRAFNITNTAGNVTLQGLTITHGKTTADGQGGGGIRSASAGTLTLANVNVSGNTTTGSNSAGGGIFLSAYSTLAISNSAISGNTTSGAGAGGGGIFAAAGGTLVATGTRISANSTGGDQSPGGGLFWHDGSITLTETIIADNSTQGAGSSGGGVSANLSDANITDTTVSGNIVKGAGSAGAGLFAQQGAVELHSSTVSDNTTQGANGAGGGIRVVSGSLTLINSTIANNSVTHVSAAGGGLSVDSASLKLTNCTIAANTAAGTAQFGGGISAVTGNVTILNSIVAENTNGGAPDLAPGSGVLIVNYSLIGDNSGTGLNPAALGFADEYGNLIGSAAVPIDPQFGSLAAFGGPTKTFSLRGISPAINAGDNDLAGGLAIDQRGLPRVFDDDVDMGAFEHQSAAVDPIVAFSLSAQTVAESSGSVDITVTLSTISPHNITIPLLISGTATEREDYTTAANLLFIPAGAISGTFTITILDDASFEANETVILTMGTITNGIAGGLAEHTLTISNNDTVPSVGLNSASQMVGENAGVVSVVVNLSIALSTDTIIPFTLGGTAGNPDDYTPNPANQIVIPAGSTAATIQLSIINDTTIESNETVIVSLGTPSNGMLASIFEQTITIVDNDSSNGTGGQNVAPTLGNPGPAPHFRQIPSRTPVRVFSEITVTDFNGSADLAQIVISVSLHPGKNRDVISYSSTLSLGTLTSTIVNGRRELKLNLRDGVTTSQVQTFLRSVTFATSKGGLKTPNRDFRVNVTDRGGLTSNVVTQNVAVSKV